MTTEAAAEVATATEKPEAVAASDAGAGAKAQATSAALAEVAAPYHDDSKAAAAPVPAVPAAASAAPAGGGYNAAPAPAAEGPKVVKLASDATQSEQMAKARQSKEQSVQKGMSLGTVDKRSLAVGGAGAGGGLGLNAPGHGPKVKHFAPVVDSTKKIIAIDENIIMNWAKVLDDSDPTRWVLCEYSADGKSINLMKVGVGGLADFKKNLGDALLWGGFRCAGVDKRGGVICKRPKFVFVQYKPEAASAIKKAKQASHKGDVKNAIEGAHLDVVVESLDDLDEQTLVQKLQAATGAHKPNGYEFEDGVFVEADFYGLGIGKDCKGETSVANAS
eukprot:TRINITY_DN39724_c0_g1_i1.p1 TRINITY_DN39724_c0_g1~~TRINITY_DN39724_c0_g1_i1.p1  ORF type:complete len:333 (+),score=98.74 TRINITY_DN39724_c0_g1_i1:69-1067(+)